MRPRLAYENSIESPYCYVFIQELKAQVKAAKLIKWLRKWTYEGWFKRLPTLNYYKKRRNVTEVYKIVQGLYEFLKYSFRFSLSVTRKGEVCST